MENKKKSKKTMYAILLAVALLVLAFWEGNI